jgi:5-oxopent-3-ene-1,2,5-tricarboxylate decarboxylase/2-hydroxyhepta-2,4-diene-1,7-dioate isomerase
VKNRDATTPLGPWIVDAADIGDPQDLALTTRINGATVQAGSTSDMVFDVAGIIAYLSDFMSLAPGDMILTGTPHGVQFVSHGDEVACEIEKIGCLVNHVEGRQ